jgi:hypothetical protein
MFDPKDKKPVTEEAKGIAIFQHKLESQDLQNSKGAKFQPQKTTKKTRKKQASNVLFCQ